VKGERGELNMKITSDNGWVLTESLNGFGYDPLGAKEGLPHMIESL
jgi:hypothetical protein